jgi:hypothetical protein
MNDKLKALAEIITKETLEHLHKMGITYQGHERSAEVKIIPGKKYIKIDMGGSGKYMVVNETGEIFGIKAYGVIHRGHRFGTLDTISDYYWGEYRATRRNS